MMKFIITESKLEMVIFNFLDSLIDFIEFHGDFWFYYKGTNKVVAKYDYEKKILKTSTWATKEMADTFSLDRYDESQSIFENWIRIKMGDKMVKEVQITPYTMYLPEYLSINLI